MLSAIAFGLVTSFLLLLAYKSISLWRNVRLAKATGLPYVITPFLETEIVALCATPLLRVIYNDYLNKGKGWPKWCRFIVRDWSWEDKRLTHDELGDVFLCVSPEGLICYSADASMAWDVTNRRYDFIKPADRYKTFELYGPNVLTAEGQTYRSHVRITAPPFKDTSGVNELVWKETTYQTQRLSQVWTQTGSRHLQRDVSSLTLAVISLASFGKRAEWAIAEQEQEEIPVGHQMSFLHALHVSTAHLVPILLFPRWFMEWTWMGEAARAQTEMEEYLKETIQEEKKNIQEDENYQSAKATGNLLTAVMRATMSEEQEQKTSVGAGLRKKAFDENDAMGNLWVFLAAGYETTANAISYALVVLALDEGLQSKIIEEIDEVYASAEAAGRNELSYRDDFKNLKYTYGFMFEIFRLFPGAILITKMATKPQPIKVTNPGTGEISTYLLPAETRVYLSVPGIHYHPKYWPDPYKLDPHRWLAERSSENQKEDRNKYIAASDKVRSMNGTLLTFSDGARVCLGKKIAQSEFMAFFATLLRDYRVKLGLEEDRSKVERDLYLRCAGKVALALHSDVKLNLEPRKA